MAIQRYSEGLNSVSADNPVGMLPYLDPTKWCVWMEDFFFLPEPTSQWTHNATDGIVTCDSAGGTGSLVQSLGGTHATDNDYSQIYPKVTVGNFTMASGKKMIFEAKVTVAAGGTVGLQELFVGLGTVQATNNFIAADGLTLAVDNCVGFWSGPTTANISCVSRVADVESIQSAATTYALATATVLSFYFDGTTIKFYKGDTKIAELFTYPVLGMVPTLWIKCGEAQIISLKTDYILVARER